MPLIMKKTINGQPVKIRLTADTGTGAPVGSIIIVCSNILPSGYLGLGVQYDITNYPALYQVLGTDTTPTASALGLPTLSSGQYAIKATSGLTENQQENVLNTINENLSYSTTEHKTGKKWIDGKPIYRKVIDCGALPDTASKSVAHNITNIGTIIKVSGTASRTGATLPLPYVSTETNVNVSIALYVTPQNVIIQDFYDMTDYTSTYVILEYTKTTD